ncbi:porin [Flavobacterium sp.]|uniref:outer membrane beta-barrel protein n=1 Tax=Flavobacterium sp. TaxID=239 RepID=UPI001B642B47|nr:porin [Flavobacterium sp.]MBP6182419.1 porin [Flavobacterium sp.]
MKKAGLILALMLTTSMTFAQETPAPATTFAGSADMYYKYDFANLAGNGKTSFTNSHNSFELGMASIEASHKMGKASVFVDLGFGNRAKEFTYNDNASSFMIKQLNFTYELSDKFKVTAGSFGTHIGYELLDAVDNKNYSMSYAFTNGPFFNTGVKAQYTSGKVSFMAGVTNPTDFKTAIEAGSTQKTFIGQVAYVGDSGSIYFNATSGSSNPATSVNKTQFDVVASKKISDKFSLGFNGTYALINDDVTSANDEKWFALIGYASYAAKDNLSLAYRLEYFDATDAAVTLSALGGSSIVGNTLSLNYKVGNLTIIPEVRVDLSSEDVFNDSDALPTSSNAYLLLGTTYTF